MKTDSSPARTRRKRREAAPLPYLETGGGGDGIWHPSSPNLLGAVALQVCSKPAGPLLVVAFEAALLVVGFLTAPGVAHEPEAAGAVDLQAGPGLEEDWETGSGGDWETGRR
jgi:hypothetical protein